MILSYKKQETVLHFYRKFYRMQYKIQFYILCILIDLSDHCIFLLRTVCNRQPRRGKTYSPGKVAVQFVDRSKSEPCTLPRLWSKKTLRVRRTRPQLHTSSCCRRRRRIQPDSPNNFEKRRRSMFFGRNSCSLNEAEKQHLRTECTSRRFRPSTCLQGTELAPFEHRRRLAPCFRPRPWRRKRLRERRTLRWPRT